MAGGNLNDFPEIKEIFDKLSKEKEKIRAKSKPLWDKYNKLQADFDPINKEMREISDQIHKIERPRLIEIDQQLAALARSIGGKSTAD